MNILIVGGNSLLGRNLVKILERGNKIYVTVRNKNHLKFQKNDNLSVIEMDLTNFKEDILPNKIDAIFYLAQSNRFREFPEGSLDMLNINVVVPSKLVKWAVLKKVKTFIYASSGGVYTNPNKPVKEFFKINANNKLGYYLNSKLSAEMLLKNYATFFETFVIIRPFFMYGPGQNKTMLIPRLIENVKNSKPIQIQGEEGIYINPIYAHDAAHAVANILKLQGEYIINIAGNEVLSLKEISIIIGNILDKKPIFEYFEKQNSDFIADTDTMQSKLYIPKVNFISGIQNMVKNS